MNPGEFNITGKQMRWVFDDNLGIIFHISLKTCCGYSLELSQILNISVSLEFISLCRHMQCSFSAQFSTEIRPHFQAKKFLFFPNC